jgi:hypothetical protein
MKALSFYFFAACLVLSACNNRYMYQPVTPQANATTSYNQGLPVLEGNLGAAPLHADLTSRGKRDMALRLSIENGAQEPLTFEPEKIKVTGYNASGQAAPFKVYTAEEYIRHRNTRNAIIVGSAVVATVAIVAIAANADSKDIGKPGHHRNENYSYFFDPFWFNVPTFFIQAGTRQAEAASNVYMPQDGLLRRHTIYSGELLQGVVRIKAKPGYTQRIKIEIPDAYGLYQSFEFDHQMRLRL